MILVLAVRFRKCIALFLYGVFYSQLILAAATFRGYGDSHGYDFRTTNLRMTGTGRKKDGRTPVIAVLPAIADSNGAPGRNAGRMKDLPASLSLRPGPMPLANRTPHPSHVSDNITTAQSFIGGPNQPEMQSFQSV